MGVIHDVLRHLVQFGPARNDAERADLLGQLDSDDPDVAPVEHVMTAEEKAAEYDRLQAAQPAGPADQEGSPA